MKPVNTIVGSFQESIFSTITQLAVAHQAINLSQGFPDFDGPDWVKELVSKALFQGKNQYASSWGTPNLRQAIARNYDRFYGLAYHPTGQILVTNGATEAIYATITALVNPGDEVVVFEPVYDSYLASLALAGAVVKVVTLQAPDFHYDPAKLASLVSARTKLLILNNPHNPTGKVFTRQELEAIAGLAERHDFYILSDEVYEFLTFGGEHIPVASLEGMIDRVITISSIGKTLSLTGWKIGWACGSNRVMAAIHAAHQFMSFCVAHPLQEAVAEALDRMDSYLPEFRSEYQRRKDLLVSGLKALGFPVLEPAGTYFALSEVPPGKTDVEYCRELILEKRVATIPASVFYVSEERRQLIRFCFAKKEETLKAALQGLG
jgi:N-succinyldiaminopimelate aminotransferase